MNFAQAHQAFEERMSAQWTVSPIHYEGSDLDPVEDDLTEWVGFIVLEGGAVNDGLKQKWQRRTGLVQADIYVSKSQSNYARRARELMDTFDAIFANEMISGARFQAGTTVNGAPSVSGYYRKTSRIPFVLEEAD